MPKLPKPLKGTIIEDSLEALSDIGSQTLVQAKKAGPQIAKAGVSQVTGQYQGSKKPQQPSIKEPSTPTTQEVVNRFYGADQKDVLPDTRLTQKQQQEEVKKQKRLSVMRQRLHQMIEKKPEKKEPSVQEQTEMEKQEKEKQAKKQAKKQLPPPPSTTGRPKGLAALNPLAWKKYRAARGAEVKGGAPSA